MSLYRLRRWNILIFAGAACTSLSLGIEQLNNNFENSPALWSLGLDVINTLGCGYWLTKVTVAAFFHTGLRWWWEGEPRYRIKFPVQITVNDEVRNVYFIDISTGGALIDLGKTRRLTPGDSLIAEWSFFNLHFRLRAQVIHNLKDAGNFCGVEFWIPDHATKTELRRLTHALHWLRVEYRPTRPGVSGSQWHLSSEPALPPPPPPLINPLYSYEPADSAQSNSIKKSA